MASASTDEIKVLRQLQPKTEFLWLNRVWILLGVNEDGSVSLTEKNCVFASSYKGDMPIEFWNGEWIVQPRR